MRSTIVFLSLALIAFAGCMRQSPSQQADAEESADSASVFSQEAHQAFFDNLSALCGKAYAGKQTYRSPHGSSWADLELVMFVEKCEPGLVAIPFRVGDDRSRTWLFMEESGALRFRHDHRHPDGTPEDETLYGGYATTDGNAFEQYFPADAYTADLIDGGGGNVWTVSISEDLSTFTYLLSRDGEKRFSLEFDLTSPLNPSEY